MQKTKEQELAAQYRTMPWARLITDGEVIQNRLNRHARHGKLLLWLAIGSLLFDLMGGKPLTTPSLGNPFSLVRSLENKLPIGAKVDVVDKDAVHKLAGSFLANYYVEAAKPFKFSKDAGSTTMGDRVFSPDFVAKATGLKDMQAFIKEVSANPPEVIKMFGGQEIADLTEDWVDPQTQLPSVPRYANKAASQRLWVAAYIKRNNEIGVDIVLGYFTQQDGRWKYFNTQYNTDGFATVPGYPVTNLDDPAGLTILKEDWPTLVTTKRVKN